MAEEAPKDEKTEDATPRKRDEAREQGQVPISTEFIAAMLLIAWMGAFVFAGGHLGKDLGNVVKGGIERIVTVGTSELGVTEAARILLAIGREGALMLGVFIGPMFLVGFLVGYGQVGFGITPKAVALKPEKLDPIKGLGRLFSMRAVVKTGMASAKILLIGGVMLAIGWMQIEDISKLGGTDLGPTLRAVGHVILKCATGAILVVLAISLIDLAYQRYQHERDLKMSKQEVKDDMKSTEGDPHVKARIRAVQRELSSQRMMQDVPKATVVITNPTHYAVALLYEREGEDGRGASTPRVVAKGVDHVAQRIKEIAREADVICFEDVPLARALHAQCEIGDEIPVDLFQAVASVLAYVYRVHGDPVPAGV